MAQNTAFVAVFNSGVFDVSRGDVFSEIGAVNDEDRVNGKPFVIINGMHGIDDGRPGAQFPLDVNSNEKDPEDLCIQLDKKRGYHSPRIDEESV
ncbi:hypothetical protein EDD16DRAFT_1701684 [Pisolithus croceorrhizus]|nr:hypothetical protein EDD16DRAFT_1701684 [Pisolithus croceorrhizus]